MVALKPNKGAPAPLLDRLVDDDPQVRSEPMPRRTLDLEGLAASVETEVRRVLNTRCPFRERDIDYEARTVVDYGLIDISPYFTGNPQDQARLSRHVAQTIAAYEPRLSRIAVTVERLHREVRALDVRIDGDLIYDDVVQPVSFPIRIAPAGDDGARADTDYGGGGR